MTRRTRSLSSALAAALAAGSALGPAQASASLPPAAEPERTPYVQQVEVNLVVMHVTVLDRRGEPVTGLEARDFQIHEDGVPREIAVFGSSLDQPVRVAFLLDVSGSMALLGKLERAKDAIRRFAAALLPEDETALLAFADGRVAVALEFTRDRQALHRVLAGTQAYGQTALRDALAEAPLLLSSAEGGRKALVIMTDGIDNASTVTTFEAIGMARQAAVPIFAVGLADLPLDLWSDRRPSDGGRTVFETLTEFTRGTGGEFFPVFKTEEIRVVADRLGERLRAQYVLGYHPGPAAERPGFHRVDVTTKNSRHQVLARPGYRS